jgi:LmbE family N-acetylglucosaminyl deacetylase
VTNRQRVLMVVHAHPDDESSQTGGTLARYSAAGYRTVLVTCTDGRRGDGPNGVKAGEAGHDPDEVAEHRSRELDLAATALGVSDVVKLGFPDSGIPDDPALAENTTDPASFSVRPPGPLARRVEQVMRSYRPDVVVTYPPNGLSGHPDHIRTHESVAAAHRNVLQAGGFRYTDVEGVEQLQLPPKLYYIALSTSQLRAVVDVMRAAFGPDAWTPSLEMATDDALITTVIDIAAYWGHKLRALSAHASQADAASLLQLFQAADPGTAAARVETYMRAYPAAPAGLEHDLFDSAGSS